MRSACKNIFKLLTATAVAAVIVFATIAVRAALTDPPIVKLNPESVLIESSGAWVEDQSVWPLFDRDTGTSFSSAARVLVTLSAQAEIRLLKIHGPAAFDLKVYEDSSGAWKPVPGLDAIGLRSQPAAWNSFSPASPLTARKLMLEFAAAGGTAGGVKEIEIWGTEAGDPFLTLKGIKTAADAGTILAASPRPAHIVDVAASPDTIEIPAGDAFYASIFTVNIQPVLIKRAYLLYESYNAAYLVNPEKNLNGGSWTGGFTLASDNPQWTSQLEEINPAWL